MIPVLFWICVLFSCDVALAGVPDEERGQITDVIDGETGVSTGVSFSQNPGTGTVLISSLRGNTDNDETSLSVREGTTTTITTFAVTGVLGETQWTSSNNIFTLTRKTQTEAELHVTEGETLNYESEPTLTSVLSVTNTSVNGNITLTLTLTDVNDAPVFNENPYIATVPDGSGEGTVATTVIASDEDVSSENNTIVYIIIDGNQAGDWFLDYSSGIISVEHGRTINSTVTSTYDIVVNATDNGSPPQAATTTVTITVSESVITFSLTDDAGTTDTPLRGNISNDTVSMHVEEGTTSSIATITVNGITGATTWTSSNAALSVTSTAAGIGTLAVAAGQALDYETETVVTSTLTVVDSATPVPATGVLSLTLNLTDVNDNAPSFDATTTDVYVPDGTSEGTVVAKVTAIDADATYPNNNMVYSIRCYGTNEELVNERHRTYTCSDLKFDTDFEVDSYTGDITVAIGRTISSIDEYELMITATDRGVNPSPLTGTVTVVINTNSAPSGVVMTSLLPCVCTVLTLLYNTVSQ